VLHRRLYAKNHLCQESKGWKFRFSGLDGMEMSIIIIIAIRDIKGIWRLESLNN